MGGRAGVLAWIVAGIVLVACGVAASLREDDQTTAYRIGAALGAIVLPLVIAAVVWKLGTTLARRPRPLLHPWMGLIAAAIGFVVLIGRTGEEARERAEAAADPRAERCLDAREPFGVAPAELRYDAVESEELQQLRDQFGREARELEMRAVLERGARIGILLGFSGDGGHDQFVDGAREGAEDQGGEVRETRVAGQDVLLLELPGRTMIVGRRGCASVSVIAADARSARLIAEPVLD